VRSVQARDELLEGMQAETIEQVETILEAIDRGSLEAEMIALKIGSRRGRPEPRPSSPPEQAEDKIAGRRRRRRRRDPRSETRTVLLRRRQGVGVSQAEARDGRGRQGLARLSRPSSEFDDDTRIGILRADQSRCLLGARHPTVERKRAPDRQGSDGASKIASELSKGTRFQLYLRCA